ncbi:uncharacterized mitochondrial protein AtMg00810-like [Nicotiana tomentosiformis]|uniref:uncharacterized mitochondrial protein AtMg00810-like n=1 Tax=Nicotiana tomentosiformis TaxID=4098 RepID=UPI000877F65C
MKEQVNKIREVTKEPGTDVAKLRLDMGATRRQEIWAFNSMTEKMDKITKEVETSYDSFCTKVTNTLKIRLRYERRIRNEHDGRFNFLSWNQIKQTPKGIFISQTKYTKELIKNFGMKNAKSIGTPMSPTTTLEEDNNGKSVDEMIYKGMIGSLLYLTTSQSDIMFSVCKCARFQSAPKESHLTAVKHIIRYLIGTSELGLWYAHSNNSILKGFSDVDFAGDKIDMKSTSDTCQLLGNALISWHSKEQNCVALSTTEAEYLAVRS